MMKNTKKGFTLFTAVLFSSMLLVIGLSLVAFALKQTLISSIGRESQFAFYAADSGIECTLYWDLVNNIFPTSTDSILPSGSTCNGSPLVFSFTQTLSSATTTFAFSLSSNRCVAVTIGKNLDNDGFINTLVESRGYNAALVSGSTCNPTSFRSVERALRLRY